MGKMAVATVVRLYIEPSQGSQMTMLTTITIVAYLTIYAMTLALLYRYAL